MKKQQGFTLIELSVILLLIALFMAGYHTITKEEALTDRQASAISDLSSLKNSLEIYAKAFGRYPCPADPAALTSNTNFGVGVGGGTGSCTAANILVHTDVNPDKNVVMGMLPVRDLSIGADKAYDAWSNRLMYVVTQGVTRSLAGAGNIRILSEHTTGSPLSSDPSITTSAAWAIISFGADGIGAYPSNGGTRISSASQGGAAVVDSEQQNINHHLYAPAFDNVFLRSRSTNNTAIQFDDQLVWDDKITPCENVSSPWIYNITGYTGPDPIAWLDAAETRTLVNNRGNEMVNDGDNISTWCDKARLRPAFAFGKNYNSRPIRRNNGLNSLPVVRFDANTAVGSEDADGMLIDDGLDLSGGNFTVFIVNRHHGTIKGRTLESRDINNWWLGLDGTNHGYMANAAATFSEAESDLVWMDVVVNNSGNYTYYSNGEQKGTPGISGSYPNRLGLVSGGITGLDNPPPAGGSQSDIAEIIIVNSTSSSDRLAIEEYLETKWDICNAHGMTWNGTECEVDCQTGAPCDLCASTIPPGDWDSDTSTCTCPGALPNLGSDGKCYAACVYPKTQWNATSKICECPTATQYFYSGTCHQCPSAAPYYYGGTCNQCPSGQVWSGSACRSYCSGSDCSSGCICTGGNSCQAVTCSSKGCSGTSYLCLPGVCSSGQDCRSGCWCGSGKVCTKTASGPNYAFYSCRPSSDIRLKQDIVKVGENNGFNIYEFDYKPFMGVPGRYRGVMAQEVEKIIPAAVVNDDNGYKTVDYNMIGIPFIRIE